MEIIEFVVNSFKAGGVFMYAILMVLAVGTAIIVERVLVLFVRSRIKGEILWKQIRDALEDQQLEGAYRLCQRSQAPLARLLAAGLRTAHEGGDEKGIQRAMESILLEVLPTWEKRIHYLYTLSNVSTLIGLLGTVVGLIQSFTAVSLADPTQKAALLASGISLALNNTAFGLLVAIILMLGYSFMQSKEAMLSDELEEYAVKLQNLLGGKTLVEPVFQKKA